MRALSFSPNSMFDKFLSHYRYTRVFNCLKKQSHVRKVVDMGCGQGLLVQRLQEKGYEALGVDVQAGPSILQGDLNQPLSLSSESVDLVTSLANLEHLTDPNTNLMEIHRILKPQGQLLLTTPSPAAKPVLEFLAFKLKWIDPREILDHKQYFSKQRLHAHLISAGFSQVKVQYFQLGFNLHAIATKSPC